MVTSLECTEASSTGSGGSAFSKDDVEWCGFVKKELVWNIDSLKLGVLANGKKPLCTPFRLAVSIVIGDC